MQSLAEKDDVTDVKAHLADIADYILRKYVMTHADEYNGRSMIHATPQSLDGARQLVEKFVQEKPERNERVELQSKLVRREYQVALHFWCFPAHYVTL